MILSLFLFALIQAIQVPSTHSIQQLSIRAEKEYQLRNWEALNSVALEFTKYYPNEGRAWAYLASSLLGQNLTLEAEHFLEKGTEADPAFAGNWYNLGILRAQLARNSESIKTCLDHLVDLAPGVAIQFAENKFVSEIITPSNDPLEMLYKNDLDEYFIKRPIRRPDYPRLARVLKIQGIVSVELIVDSSGRTCKLGAVHGPKELIDSARFIAIQARFKPLLRNKLPKSFRIIYPVPFVLR